MVQSGVDESGAASSALDAMDVLDTAQAGPRAIRGGAVRIAGFATVVLLSVGSAALLFRHLGVVDSGHYVTIVSLVMLTGTMTDAGLAAIGVRELVTRSPAERGALMRSLLGLRIALALAGVAVAIAFSAIAGYAPTLILGTVIAGAAIVLTVLQDTYAIPLTATLRIGWTTAADVLRQLLTGLGILILVLAGASLLPFWAAALPAGIAATSLAAWLVRRDVPLLPSWRISSWRELLRDTLPYALATAVNSAYFRLGILIVSIVASGAQTGYYGISFRVIDVLIAVPQLLIAASFPIFSRAARDNRERLSYALGRVFDACLILGVAVALGLGVGAPFVISVVGGHAFGPADDILRIQGIALMGSFLSTLWSYALLSLRRHRQILVITFTALALSLVVTTTLTSVDGARGAAVGTVIAEAAFSLMLALAVYRTGVRPQIRWAAIPRVGVAAALAALVLIIPGLPNVAQLASALVVYGVVLLALGGIPREVLEAIPRRGRR